jgi:hypothetical protein
LVLKVACIVFVVIGARQEHRDDNEWYVL